MSTTHARHAAFCVLAAAALSATMLVPAGTAVADSPTCFGRTPTIIGTNGEDTIVTDAGRVDVIYGGGGDDYLAGEVEGDGPLDPGDYFCGGPGGDTIVGGDGPDHINGGDGNDHVEGWRGADVVQGNAGNDYVDEGSMSSQDAQNDVLRGGDGNDILDGGWGRDKIYGKAGRDKLYDLECDGPTLLNGGAGNDYLESWSSSFEGWRRNVCNSVADRMVGSTGTDTAQVDRRDIVSTVERVTRIRRPTG